MYYWSRDYCELISKYVTGFAGCLNDQNLLYPKIKIQCTNHSRIASLPGFISPFNKDEFIHDLEFLISKVITNTDSLYLQYLGNKNSIEKELIKLPSEFTTNILSRKYFEFGVSSEIEEMKASMNTRVRRYVRRCFRENQYVLKREENDQFSQMYLARSVADSYKSVYRYGFDDLQAIQKMPGIEPMMLYRNEKFVGGCIVGIREGSRADYILAATEKSMPGESQILMLKASEAIHSRFETNSLNLGGGESKLEDYKRMSGGVAREWIGLNVQKI